MISIKEEPQFRAGALGYLERGCPGAGEHARSEVARGRILPANDLNATPVFEADWLDRYGPVGRARYSRILTDLRNLEELERYPETDLEQG